MHKSSFKTFQDLRFITQLNDIPDEITQTQLWNSKLQRLSIKNYLITYDTPKKDEGSIPNANLLAL